MKIYKLLFLLVLGLVMTGCASEPKIVTKDVIVYKYKKVYVPTPCDVTVKCDFTGEGYEPTSKLLECVIDQKRALEYCMQAKGASENDHN